MENENLNIMDIDLTLIDKSIIKETLKECQVKYLNAFINIELYNYLMEQMEWYKEWESKEWIEWLNVSIENTRQQKLATIKMIGNHTNNINTLKQLL